MSKSDNEFVDTRVKSLGKTEDSYTQFQIQYLVTQRQEKKNEDSTLDDKKKSNNNGDKKKEKRTIVNSSNHGMRDNNDAKKDGETNSAPLSQGTAAALPSIEGDSVNVFKADQTKRSLKRQQYWKWHKRRQQQRLADLGGPLQRLDPGIQGKSEK